MKALCHHLVQKGELGEAILVDLPHIKLIHDLIEAPEDKLLVLNIEQQNGDYVVDPLHVAYFLIDVGIGHKYVVKSIISRKQIFTP